MRDLAIGQSVFYRLIFSSIVARRTYMYKLGLSIIRDKKTIDCLEHSYVLCMIVLQNQNYVTLLYRTNLGHISHSCNILLSA